MRTIAIGDIHGGLRALVQVLNKVEVKDQDTLIFMGDYVDGWSEAAQVVQLLKELSEKIKCIFIKGNHDVWCEEWLRSGEVNPTWFMHGGKETMDSYEGFSEEDKKQLTDKFTTILKEKIVPSYNSLYTFLNTDYLKNGLEESGISAIPQGKAYYQHAIKNYTTTTMTADEIHELGLKEVARILAEMEKVKKEVGFTGDLKSFFEFVRNNKELMPYKEPQQIIANFNEIHNKMKPQLEKLFGNKPKTKFIVKQTEKFREASASAEYNPGSLDGTRFNTRKRGFTRF